MFVINFPVKLVTDHLKVKLLRYRTEVMYKEQYLNYLVDLDLLVLTSVHYQLENYLGERHSSDVHSKSIKSTALNIKCVWVLFYLVGRFTPLQSLGVILRIASLNTSDITDFLATITDIFFSRLGICNSQS